MFIKEFLPQACLTFSTYEEAATVQKILIDNGYCTLMGREEQLWTLNWIWTTPGADRNDVIFAERQEYECNEWQWFQNHPEYGNEE